MPSAPARHAGTQRLSGPPERVAPFVVGAFLLIQLGLLGQALAPLLFSWPWQPRWPWSMFNKQNAAERYLEAVAFTSSGDSVPVPLEQIFTYTRGFTRCHAYDQTNIFDRADQEPRRAVFAQFLARSLAARGVPVTRVDLAFKYVNLDTAQVERRPIGSFVIESAR